MNDARSLTLSLGDRWHGRYGEAPCPVCQPERRRGQNALTLAEQGGRLLLDCKKRSCDFRDLLAALGVMPGAVAPLDPLAEARRRADELAEAEKRSQWARRVWDDTLPIRGTPAEAYLRGRAITCALPASLRFAPSCWYSRELRLPAMVALVEGASGFAVHRTYLRPDGSGKADVGRPKAMLGPVSGGAVRLVEPPQDECGALVVAEGTETALSLASGLLSAPATIWAALSTSGLRSLRLPPQAGRLTVAADGDGAGRQAALELAKRAARDGWDMYLLPAPEGQDWNVVLREAGAGGAAA